jgi:hypothetical protein
MSWVITGTQKTDPDALAYLAEVERADGQALESGTRDAVIAFVTGCKADGIWNAIKASCILAGARTLEGALVPLVGAAPTNFNFVAGDYNRKTGPVGNGSTKYLDSGRANDADPQDSQHLAVFLSTATATNRVHIGAGGTSTGASGLGVSNTPTAAFQRSRESVPRVSGTLGTGFYGKSRSSFSSFTNRCSGTSTVVTSQSENPSSDNLFVFARNNGSGVPELFLGNRMSFYSIGESLDLALLDARVTTLINAFDAAI